MLHERLSRTALVSSRGLVVGTICRVALSQCFGALRELVPSVDLCGLLEVLGQLRLKSILNAVQTAGHNFFYLY